MATYTFENIVINGVDTSKTYNDSTLPLSGVKRIICNGEDKLHKNVNVTIDTHAISQIVWGSAWLEAYVENVLYSLNKDDHCVTSKEIITIGDVLHGFSIEFEKPATFYYSVEENDEVAGGWVSYDSGTVNNVSYINVEFITTGVGSGYETLEITFNRDSSTKIVIEAGMYELGMADFKFEIKGRVY